MNSRIGVIGIVVSDREQVAPKVNSLLSEYGEVIIGRMGIPYRDRGVAVIALIVDGSTDSIGALTGKLGRLPGVQVKSALTPPQPEDKG
ncbi:MAG TPA: CopG family transcriptional regulator [Clostridia bacterium]|nr:CopG family transcriptional regulator [Clostridia bacterium]